MRKSRMVAAMAAVAVCFVTLAGTVASADKLLDLSQPTTKPGSHPSRLRLTMDEAVALGLHNSRSLRSAAEAVNRARGQVNESRAAYLPNLSGSATITHLDAGQSVALPIGPNGSDVTVPLVVQDSKEIDLTAGVPIDIAGQIGAAVSAAQFQELAQRLNYNATRNQLVRDIKNAYLDVLRATEYVGVAEQTLKNAQDQESTAAAYLKAGTGTKFDVLRAQTAVADAQQSLISAKNRVNLAVAALANALAIDQNTPIETVAVTDLGAASAPFDAGVEEAYRQRPEVFQADANIHAAEKGLWIANRSQLPSLNVGWNLTYTPDAGGFSPKTTSWAAVAKVSLPIFEGGTAAARRQQAHADVNTARIAKQQVMDGVALDVRQASLTEVEARERVKVATAALTEAVEQYRLAEVRFKAGVTSTPGGSPLLEISDARTALAQAQTNRINAQYDLASAQAQLDRALGRYAYDGTSNHGLAGPVTGGVK